MSPASRRFHPDAGSVHPDVLAAARDGGGLDAAAAAAAIAAAQPALRQIFRTGEPVVVLPASVGVLREIGLRAAVDHRVLVLVAGPAGAALADTAEALGREVIRVMVHPGHTLEATQLARFLEGPTVDAVALVHAEAGTGALAPLAELASMVRSRGDALLFVDATGSLGASPLEPDAWGLDFVLAPSEGALGLPGGLAFASASARLISRAREQSDRGIELDFVAHHAAAARGATLAPVAPALAQALALQLRRMADEGIEPRWARHAGLRQAVERWVGSRRDVSLLAQPDRRSATVSCLVLPATHPGTVLVQRLAEEGWQVAPGAAPEPDRLLRIGHMGELEEAELEELLEAVGKVLSTPP
jgi:aspartate aminotransferase-like enzyme